MEGELVPCIPGSPTATVTGGARTSISNRNPSETDVLEKLITTRLAF